MSFPIKLETHFFSFCLFYRNHLERNATLLFPQWSWVGLVGSGPWWCLYPFWPFVFIRDSITNSDYIFDYFSFHSILLNYCCCKGRLWRVIVIGKKIDFSSFSRWLLFSKASLILFIVETQMGLVGNWRTERVVLAIGAITFIPFYWHWYRC